MSLLGLDVGTSGVKALLIDASGKTLASATSEYPLSTPHPNWAEQDPADWWKGTIEVIRNILAAPGVKAEDIKGIGLSGQMHSLVLLDAQQRVLRPSILWCDTRTDKECRQITEQVGRERLRSLVSNPALEGFTLPKIIWVRTHEPEVYARIRTILLPKDYIRFLLTGEFAMEVSDAAGTLMFDVARRAWSKELLRILDVPAEWLPPVFESVDVCGRITRATAELTGLPEGTPVVGGGADNPCGAVGTGVVKQGRVLASIGTSGVVFAFSDQVRVEPGMRVHTFCHSVPGAWYLMGVVLMAGGALRWYRDTFAQDELARARTSGRDVYDILTEGASAVTPGSEGLFFLPYLVGERTPHQSASARGAFIGATIRHTKNHFTRAVLEGISFGMKDSLSIMEGLGVEITQIRLTGGGAKSAFWRRLQANVYGREVALVNASEGPAFGAALLAGAGAKVYSNLIEAVENAVRVTETVAPDPGQAERYAELFGIYQSLYPALRTPFTQIHELRR